MNNFTVVVTVAMYLCDSESGAGAVLMNSFQLELSREQRQSVKLLNTRVRERTKLG